MRSLELHSPIALAIVTIFKYHNFVCLNLSETWTCVTNGWFISVLLLGFNILFTLSHLVWVLLDIKSMKNFEPCYWFIGFDSFQNFQTRTIIVTMETLMIHILGLSVTVWVYLQHSSLLILLIIWSSWQTLTFIGTWLVWTLNHAFEIWTRDQ